LLPLPLAFGFFASIFFLLSTRNDPNSQSQNRFIAAR